MFSSCRGYNVFVLYVVLVTIKQFQSEKHILKRFWVFKSVGAMNIVSCKWESTPP